MDINSFKIKKEICNRVCVSPWILYSPQNACDHLLWYSQVTTQSVTTLACVLGEVCPYLWVVGSECVVKQIFWDLSLIQKYTCKCFVWVLSMVFNSWIKVDQLDVACFIISLFTAQHVSNISTSIFRSLLLIVDLFCVLYCSGLMCVGVTVWFGRGGVVSLCRLKH